MFLEENGNLWTCGESEYGRLGLGHYKDGALFEPTKIPFFVKENIVIKDVKCGYAHNLALDINGKVYSWGSNYYGQCGHNVVDEEPLMAPKLIESVKDYIVDVIDCGCSHSYIKTEDGRHYLFGSNDDGECITFNDENKIIAPFRVDEIIKQHYNAQEIIQMVLGYGNTKVIVSV